MRQAQALVKNEVLETALLQAEVDTVRAWKAERDRDVREMLWARQQAIQLIRSNINVAIKRELGDKPEQQQSGE